MNRTTRLAIGAVCGALLSVALSGEPSQLAAACVVAGALATCARLLGGRGGFAQALAIGAALILLRATAGAVLAPPPAPDDSNAVRTGLHAAVVVSVGTPDGGLQRATVRLQPPEPAELVYAWLPRYPQIAQADLIRFSGTLEQPPETGDFADYLARSGISHTARAGTLAVLGTDGSAIAALEDMRRAAADLMTRVLPEPQAGLATAMAIGLRDLVSKDVTTDFRTAGLSHVVAISGWQITVIGAVVAAMLGGLARRPRSAIVLLSIFAYTVLAGAAPSILRAALMAGAAIVARESGRRGQAASALALTCICLLLLDPATVTDAGFQLSAVATAGLLAWTTPLGGWLKRRLPDRTPAWLLEALAVSLAAQAATLPLILVQFGQLSIVAPLANLLVAPLVAPAMLVTAICFVAGAAVALGVPALVIAPVSLVGSLVVGAMIAIAHVCAALPLASVILPEPLNYVGAGVALGALLIGRRLLERARRTGRNGSAPGRTLPRFTIDRRWLLTAGAAISLSLLVAVVASARPDGRLHVTVLDIGQGDAILLQGANGGRMMIDTGPDPDRLMTVLDARIPSWDRRIDVVLLTHPHEDHVGGLALLLQRYHVGQVLETGMTGPGPGDHAYRAELAAEGRSTTIVAAGGELTLDGARLHIDWPPPDTVPLRAPDDNTAINDESLVVDLHYGARRMLFTGDIEQDVDPKLIAAGIAQRLGGPLDVLKVAHHGSGTATTNAFLDVVQPRVAIISVGANNDYGHPSPATIQRLAAHGASVYRTDLDGSVEVSTNGRDLSVRAEHRTNVPLPMPRPSPVAILEAPARAWHAGRTKRRRDRSYNRIDVRPHPRPSCRDRPRPAAQRAAVAALDGRGRGRNVPGFGHGTPRRGRGPGARRRGGAAARPGQDAAW